MHDREEVLGRIPEGLRRCDQCGELHGRCLDPEPPDRSVLRPVTVSCLCEGTCSRSGPLGAAQTGYASPPARERGPMTGPKGEIPVAALPPDFAAAQHEDVERSVDALPSLGFYAEERAGSGPDAARLQADEFPLGEEGLDLDAKVRVRREPLAQVFPIGVEPSHDPKRRLVVLEVFVEERADALDVMAVPGLDQRADDLFRLGRAKGSLCQSRRRGRR